MKTLVSRAFVTLIFTVALLFSVTFHIQASCGSKEECEGKIKEYEQKLTAIKQEKNTLSSQIKLMNTQINLTTVKVKNTENLIESTQKEIDTLGGRIEDLNTSLETLSTILLTKIVEDYKERPVSVFSYIINSDRAESLVNKGKYLDAAKKSDQLLAVKLQQSKLTFEDQKHTREEKVKQLEDLKISLAQQQKDLDTKKTQKQQLLTQTNGEEGKYQQLLEQALAEFNAIERATATGSKVGPVKKGDPIAIMGNTGYPFCSTGKHLHFEVRKDSKWADPNSYLNGGWTHPLSPPVNVTQGFGVTPWSYRYTYSGGIHTGLDMTSDSSDVIRAPADGVLYSSSQACKSATIKIKYIDHGDGVISYYLHVRE